MANALIFFIAIPLVILFLPLIIIGSILLLPIFFILAVLLFPIGAVLAVVGFIIFLIVGAGEMSFSSYLLLPLLLI